MQTNYIPQQIEPNIQELWREKDTFKTKEDFNKEKFFCLAMIPYPSGHLHIGHVRNYTIGDVIARYQRMRGKNVMQPFGWDAFGLPAENAALKNKTAPAKWTYQNIEHMREQLHALGLGYDWSREIMTCSPDYYRWEQWLFLQMFKKGLAYKKLSTVNWDPIDQTVLANEQVIDGKGWRSGAPVERKHIQQWFLKITDYADELLDDLEQLTAWPEQVRTMQKNWIGRSYGTQIHFGEITVFTTRPETLMGVTYLTLSPEHPLTQAAATENPAIQAFLKATEHTKVAEAEIACQEKLGVFLGIYAKHPISGEDLPVWAANYVLADYGSGAVMAVPAHDERDREFAEKYDLPSKIVLEDNKLINSGIFTGLTIETAIQQINEQLIASQQGKIVKHYRLHDWGISRQRYWGAPIPMIYCERCGDVPVAEEDLPIRLPENVEFKEGIVTLKDLPEFYKTICPHCGDSATRETDTFDTFIDSSWYYARMACADQEESMLDNRAQYWTPVDQYIGGIEHAVMHLLYARFIHKVMRDEGLVNSDEPFVRLLTQGMVLKDGAKMSKSKGNTVDPQTLINQYGADSVRLFVIFTAPPEQSLEWSDSGFEGCFRFLKRVWTFAVDRRALLTEEEAEKFDIYNASEEQRDAWREIYLILKQADYDYERYQLNTVVSGCMKLFNLLGKIPAEKTAAICDNQHQINRIMIKTGFKILLALLSPIAPHICQQLWSDLELGDMIVETAWPKVQTSALVAKTMHLVVQVNGKLRAKIALPQDAEQAAIEEAALADPNVSKHIEHKTIKKIIIVPQRLVNIVMERDA